MPSRLHFYMHVLWQGYAYVYKISDSVTVTQPPLFSPAKTSKQLQASHACLQAGVSVHVHRLPANVSQSGLEAAVAAVCADTRVDGVLLQVRDCAVGVPATQWIFPECTYITPAVLVWTQLCAFMQAIHDATMDTCSLLR